MLLTMASRSLPSGPSTTTEDIPRTVSDIDTELEEARLQLHHWETKRATRSNALLIPAFTAQIIELEAERAALVQKQSDSYEPPVDQSKAYHNLTDNNIADLFKAEVASEDTPYPGGNDSPITESPTWTPTGITNAPHPIENNENTSNANPMPICRSLYLFA